MPVAAGLAGLGLATATGAERGQRVQWPEVRLLDGQGWGATQAQHCAVVVVFFSTTCPYCRRHNAHVNRLRHAQAGRPLQVLGVAADRDPAVVRRYLDQHGWQFAVTLDAAPLHAALSARRIMPLTCVVDRTGVLQEVIAGEMFEDDVLGLARWAAGA